MLGRIFRSRTPNSGESKQRGKQSKHIGKQSRQENKQQAKRSSNSTSKTDHKDGSFTQTSPSERREMFALRQSGLGVGAIAKRLGRSGRTVYEVLTERGTRPLPNAEELLQDDGLPEPEEIDCPKRRKRRRRGDRMAPSETEPSDSLGRRLGRILDEKVADAVRALKINDEFALQILAAHFGVKIPKKTVDDMVWEEVKSSPELRRQLAEDYVERQKRSGRTDTEIAAEVLDLAIKIAEMMARGRWPDVVEKAVTSGEIRKTLQVLLGKESRDVQEHTNLTTPQSQIPPSVVTLATLPEGTEGEAGTRPPFTDPAARAGHENLQPAKGDKWSWPAERAESNPDGNLLPSMPNPATTQPSIKAPRGDFAKQVDWQDLERGVQGDPAEFVAHRWGSGNSSHGVTLIVLMVSTAFRKAVERSVTQLRDDPDRKEDYEVARRVQSFLTGTEHGKRWLEAAHTAAVTKFQDELAKRGYSGETRMGASGTPPEDEDDTTTLI